MSCVICLVVSAEQGRLNTKLGKISVKLKIKIYLVFNPLLRLVSSGESECMFNYKA